MERRINRRQQGDLGEASAIEWLTRRGAMVLAPLGHSPAYDLVAELEGDLLRVQVKTSTVKRVTPDAGERWSVALCTNGGNQSWSGMTKRFDPATVDHLFVLVGDGRRWFIPAFAVEGLRALRLGGRKYSEFEIERAAAILPLVFDSGPADSRIGASALGERRSGRAGPDCKFGALVAEGVRIPPPPSSSNRSRTQWRLGRAGQAVIRSKRQMTMPLTPFTEAGLVIGDRLRFRADGPGRVAIERIEEPPL